MEKKVVDIENTGGAARASAGRHAARKGPHAVAQIALACALAGAFLLVFSRFTSPLSAMYGYDAAFFQLVGAGMTDGLLPYRDFFDMKGPYLFFAEFAGQLLLKGRTGAFALQCASLAVTLFLVFKMIDLARLRRPLASGLLACIAFLAMLATTLEGGNLTEELSLPLIMGSLLVSMRYLARLEVSPAASYGWAGAIFQGVIVSVLAFVRITNAAYVLGLLLCAIVAMAARRDLRGIARSVAGFALGAAIGFAPVAAFGFATGLFDEMMRCVFGFGATYSGESSWAERLARLVGNRALMATMPIALAPLAASLVAGPRSIWTVFSAALGPAVTVVAIMLGNGYPHYATLLAPCIAHAAFLLSFAAGPLGQRRMQKRAGELGARLQLENRADARLASPGRALAHTPSPASRAPRVAAGIAVCLLLLCPQLPFIYGSAAESLSCVRYRLLVSADDPEQAAVTDVAKRIPAEDTHSVFFYGGDSVASRWYCMAGLYPCIRYCDWQEHYLQLDPRIAEDLQTRMETDPPAWLVTPARAADGSAAELSPALMREAVRNAYDLAYENDGYRLYRLKK